MTLREPAASIVGIDAPTRDEAAGAVSRHASMTRRVVVTGAAGLIGSLLIPALRTRYTVVGIDRRGRFRPRRTGDLLYVESRRRHALERAFAGADTVVDLAANSDSDASWDEVYRNNIRATSNMFEAARAAGVRRVVFASSNHVVGLYERDPPYSDVVAGRYEGLDPTRLPRIGADAPLRPDGAYAVGKIAGEAAGRYYAEVHGVSTVCLRIGSVPRTGRPENIRDFSTFLSHDDLVGLVIASIEADVDFAVVYGVSRNSWRIWDLESAAAIGYEPHDDAEQWR